MNVIKYVSYIYSRERREIIKLISDRRRNTYFM